MRTRIKQFAVASTVLLAAVALAYQATVSTLYKDGAIVSSNLKLIDGTLYVSVRDVATFMGGTVNLSTDRADIQTPEGANPEPTTTAGLAQTIAQEGPPQLTTPIATITAPPPPPVPAELTGALNQDVTFEGFSYRVTDIQYKSGDYKDQFDQRGTKLHAEWKSDRLAIISITVRNTGSEAGTPTIPGTSDFSIFDSQKVAYPTTAIDIRQAPAVLGGDFSDDTMFYGSPLSFLAPGGQLTYAVVGSLPKGNTVTMIRFHLAPASFPDIQLAPQPPLVQTTPQGGLVPVPAPAQPSAPSNMPADYNSSGADVTINFS